LLALATVGIILHRRSGSSIQTANKSRNGVATTKGRATHGGKTGLTKGSNSTGPAVIENIFRINAVHQSNNGHRSDKTSGLKASRASQDLFYRSAFGRQLVQPLAKPKRNIGDSIVKTSTPLSGSQFANASRDVKNPLVSLRSVGRLHIKHEFMGGTVDSAVSAGMVQATTKSRSTEGGNGCETSRDRSVVTINALQKIAAVRSTSAAEASRQLLILGFAQERRGVAHAFERQRVGAAANSRSEQTASASTLRCVQVALAHLEPNADTAEQALANAGRDRNRPVQRKQRPTSIRIRKEQAAMLPVAQLDGLDFVTMSNPMHD
jgi:hypothetical protein